MTCGAQVVFSVVHFWSVGSEPAWAIPGRDGVRVDGPRRTYPAASIGASHERAVSIQLSVQDRQRSAPKDHTRSPPAPGRVKFGLPALLSYPIKNKSHHLSICGTTENDVLCFFLKMFSQLFDHCQITIFFHKSTDGGSYF